MTTKETEKATENTTGTPPEASQRPSTDTVAVNSAEETPGAASIAAPADVAAPGNRPQKQSANEHNSSSGIKLSSIALVFSLLALLAGGYAWYQATVISKLESGMQLNRLDAVEQRVTGVTTGNEDNNKQLGRIKEQILAAESKAGDKMDALQQQFSSSQQALQQQADQFKLEFEGLSDSIIKLRSELGRSVQSWQLEEVEQLLIIANQRLQLAGDVELATNALQLADQRLKAISDPSLVKVRQTLALELTALGQVTSPDLVGISGRINALMATVGTLPLAGDIAATTGAAVAADDSSSMPAADNSGSWTAMSKELLKDFGRMVQVEKKGSFTAPVLSPELREVTRQKAVLMLETAQLALLRQDQQLFLDRIDATADWVGTRFKTADTEVKSWLDSVLALKQQHAVQELPDITASLLQLRGEMTPEG